MKKFFTLFALLSVALSASAEVILPPAQEGKVSIFYEAVNTSYTHIYVYGGNGLLAGGWMGSPMQEIGKTSDNHKIYLWTHDGNEVAEKIIFHNNGSETDRTEVDFVANGYYVDGVLDHVAVPEEGEHTVYFYDSKSWGNNLHIYVWHNTYNINQKAWPGVSMTSLGNNLYSYKITGANFTNIIFNNGGTGDGNQTPTLTATDGKVYVPDGTYNDYNNPNVFEADASLTITDGQDFSCAKDYAVVSASYTRSLSDNWGTLCLPFAITTVPQGVTLYTLSGVDTENKILSFASTTSVEAGQPVVFKTSGSSLVINEENVVPVSSSTKKSSTVEDWELNGSFAKIENYTPSGGTMYFFSENKFWSGVPEYIPAYRAWFIANVDFGANPAPFRIEADDTEGLQFVEQEDGTVKAYYDLQGRKLDGARKGLVIENGKIIMVK